MKIPDDLLAANRQREVESGEINGKEYGIWEYIEPIENFILCWAWGEEEWGFADDYEKAKKYIKLVSELKTYSLQEVYDSPVWQVNEGKDIHYILSLLQINTQANLANQIRVKVKSHGCKFDNLCLQSIWLDDKPVMVACKSYYDEEVYISDIHSYIELRNYLMSFVSVYYKVVDLNTPVLRKVGEYYAQQVLKN